MLQLALGNKRSAAAVVSAAIAGAGWAGKAVIDKSLTSETYQRWKLQRKWRRPLEVVKLSDRPLIKHDQVLADIERAVLETQGGVKVLAGPPGAGKTTYVCEALNKMQADGKIEGSLWVSCSESSPVRRSETLPQWLFRQLAIDSPSTSLHRLLSARPGDDRKRAVIVIDQIDHLAREHSVQSFITAVAEQAAFSSDFVCIVISKDPKFTKRILGWNAGQKISKVGNFIAHKWGAEHIECFVEQLKGSDDRLKLTPDVRKLALAAGTPGFMVDMLRSQRHGDIDDESFEALKYEAQDVEERWLAFK